MSWMTRTALELIGQSGLGFSFDSLTENSAQHPYSKAAKQLVYVTFEYLRRSANPHPRIPCSPSLFKLNMLSAYLLQPLSKVGTPKFRRWIVDTIPHKNLHAVRDIVDVIYNTSMEIFEGKKKALDDGDEALANQVGRGKDIMSILSEYPDPLTG